MGTLGLMARFAAIGRLQKPRSDSIESDTVRLRNVKNVRLLRQYQTHEPGSRRGGRGQTFLILLSGFDVLWSVIDVTRVRRFSLHIFYGTQRGAGGTTVLPLRRTREIEMRASQSHAKLRSLTRSVTSQASMRRSPLGSGTGRPSSRALSIQNCIASLMFLNAVS